MVQVSSGETNFHAWYEACAGLPIDVLEACGVAGSRDASNFAYLQPGFDERDPGRDATQFERTRQALYAVGLDEAQHTELCKLLLAILHLGNADFGEGEQAAVAESGLGASALDRASSLLETDTSKLHDGMCLRRFKAGAEWVSTSNTSQQASDVRHALSKQACQSLAPFACRSPVPFARFSRAFCPGACLQPLPLLHMSRSPTHGLVSVKRCARCC